MTIFLQRRTAPLVCGLHQNGFRAIELSLVQRDVVYVA